MNEFVLEINGLSKSYGKKSALENIDLKIERGRIIGLLGPNGSGKTTLIKLINGLLTPNSGAITVDGSPIGEKSRLAVSYLPDKTYSTMIPRNVRLGEAPSHGEPIIYYDSSSKGAESYRRLAAEILGMQ